jgi:nucleoside-diphosphate-sugar epimerase
MRLEARLADQRVLITGATGYVAGQMLPAFRERFDLTLIDSRTEDGAGRRVEGVDAADLLDADRHSYAGLFDGIDTVVGPGGVRSRPVLPGLLTDSPSGINDFFDEGSNIRMAYNVLRACFDAGVRRVVFASSNRVGDWSEHALIHHRRLDMHTEETLPRSDTFYGWSKAACEHMGFLFASGAFGRKMGVVNVRIGWPHELDVAAFGDDVTNYKRALGSYFSAADVARLFLAAVEASDIDDENGVPWQVVYGTSDNARAFWSLANGRRVLGYEPEDDSEVKYAAGVESLIMNDGQGRAPGRVSASLDEAP